MKGEVLFNLQVLPSQRQGKTATLYDVWVAINKENGWILTANCTCMAGLGSACKHVAALLSKLEAAVRYQLNQPMACTSQLCAWNASKKHENPAPIKAINFKRGKKDALPSVTSNTPVSSDHFSVKDPTTGSSGISRDKLRELHGIYSQAAVFTGIYKGDIDDNALSTLFVLRFALRSNSSSHPVSELVSILCANVAR